MQKQGAKNVVVLPGNKTVTVLVPLLMPARTGHQFRHNSDSFTQLPNVIAKFERTDPTMIAPAPDHDLPTHHRSFFFLLGFVFTERKRKWMRVGLGRGETNEEKNAKALRTDRSKSRGSWSTCGGACFYSPCQRFPCCATRDSANDFMTRGLVGFGERGGTVVIGWAARWGVGREAGDCDPIEEVSGWRRVFVFVFGVKCWEEDFVGSSLLVLPFFLFFSMK